MQLVLDDPEPEQTAPPDPGHQPVFIDPVFGTPLSIYIEKDVDNRDAVAETITVSLLLIYGTLPREKNATHPCCRLTGAPCPKGTAGSPMYLVGISHKSAPV